MRKYLCQVLLPTTSAIYMQVLLPSTATSQFIHLYTSTYVNYSRLALQPFTCQFFCQVLLPNSSAIYMQVTLPSTAAPHSSHLYASTSTKYCPPPTAAIYMHVLVPSTHTLYHARYTQLLMQSTSRLPLLPDASHCLC